MTSIVGFWQDTVNNIKINRLLLT